MLRTSLPRFAVSLLGFLALAACGGGGGYGGGGGSSGGGGSTIITQITISPGTSSVAKGKTQQYKAVTMDMNGNTVGAGNLLNWNSSNTSVATVNGSGLATAKGIGTTTITASISYNSSGGIYGGGGNPITYTSNMATLTVTASDAVMGTAAVGSPFVNALVTLKDAHGQTETGMTDSEGRFLLSTAGLKSPFLIKAEDNMGHVLFSTRSDEGIANVTPVTDSMVRAWYAAHGTTAEAAFTAPASHPAPDAASLDKLNALYTQALAAALASQGLDAKDFSFITTSFNADNTGPDRVLDNLQVHGGVSMEDMLGDQLIEIHSDDGMPVLTTSQVMGMGMHGGMDSNPSP
ncbi:MAG TPA: Ig-like domain-containing protein [Gammaproteobacteria bacterium]|nr:Ig-like domain-containing protein [Gammaproteobacteria bacterium]